ncbi:MAG: DNA repair protein RecO [Ignavibacteriaceae bacterium]|jgi:DNA repair protein RecO (recombination protein O)|nr:DNA repair protein RecO [Ignavibacteriaceae bacterium]
MSQIVKTEGIVLSKLDYSDSSKIVSIYSSEFGKISAIVKGGRGKNSKVGMVVDPLNILNLVLYNKEQREVQLISSAEMLFYFSHLHNDFERMKYSYAVIELLKYLTVDNETNQRLYKGSKKILQLMDTSDEQPEILFLKYFLFILQETGFEIQMSACSICHKEIKKEKVNGFNYEHGMLCSDCKNLYHTFLEVPMELFEQIYSLKIGKRLKNYNLPAMKKLIIALEKFLKFHVHGFNGIKSLQM